MYEEKWVGGPYRENIALCSINDTPPFRTTSVYTRLVDMDDRALIC
jgi:hypothetical protein